MSEQDQYGDRRVIPDEAVAAAARALGIGPHGISRIQLELALEAAAPYLMAQHAVAAVLSLHREMPCVDEDGDPVGGFYCEECKDLDDHSGERVHEVFPCLIVREVRAALVGEETFTAMRDRIESGVRK